MPIQSAFKKTHLRRRTFFAQWRKHRQLTQDQLADRMGTTKTRVSMKETGKEPYDQLYLEALATALNTDPASLLMRDPTDHDAIWSIWEQAKPGERRQIVEVAKTLIRTGSGG